MYVNVYLFQNKSNGPHEVDFVIRNKLDQLQISCPQTGWGGGVNRKGGLITKKRLLNGGLIREEGGGVNSEVGLNRDFTVKQQPDQNFLMSTFGPMYYKSPLTETSCFVLVQQFEAVKLKNEDLIDFNVLASSKTFQRGSSFFSLRRVKLQDEDRIDFNVLASNRTLQRGSSFFSLRRVKLRKPPSNSMFQRQLKRFSEGLHFVV